MVGVPRSFARFPGVDAWDAVEEADLLTESDRVVAGGFWAVVATFEGRARAWRFAHVEERGSGPDSQRWASAGGARLGPWSSDMTRDEYVAAVARIRDDIREGDVYQVNLCRMLSASCPEWSGADTLALHREIERDNPAPFAAALHLGFAESPVDVVSASPELFLSIEGDEVSSSPIKGTAAPGADFLEKDVAENVMIADLVRNDLAHVARPGTVAVPEFLARHEHPGLAHLQSTVAARLSTDMAWTGRMWPALMEAAFPPGSVSGAPKHAALEIIAREERGPRGPYCGAIGWIDADARRAALAVGIRTFFRDPLSETLEFGTGAGITWGSDPAAEWDETDLKANRLIGIANRTTMA